MKVGDYLCSQRAELLRHLEQSSLLVYEAKDGTSIEVTPLVTHYRKIVDEAEALIPRDLIGKDLEKLTQEQRVTLGRALAYYLSKLNSLTKQIYDVGLLLRSDMVQLHGHIRNLMNQIVALGNENYRLWQQQNRRPNGERTVLLSAPFGPSSYVSGSPNTADCLLWCFGARDAQEERDPNLVCCCLSPSYCEGYVEYKLAEATVRGAKLACMEAPKLVRFVRQVQSDAAHRTIQLSKGLAPKVAAELRAGVNDLSNLSIQIGEAAGHAARTLGEAAGSAARAVGDAAGKAARSGWDCCCSCFRGIGSGISRMCSGVADGVSSCCGSIGHGLGGCCSAIGDCFKSCFSFCSECCEACGDCCRGGGDAGKGIGGCIVACFVVIYALIQKLKGGGHSSGSSSSQAAPQAMGASNSGGSAGGAVSGPSGGLLNGICYALGVAVLALLGIPAAVRMAKGVAGLFTRERKYRGWQTLWGFLGGAVLGVIGFVVPGGGIHSAIALIAVGMYFGVYGAKACHRGTFLGQDPEAHNDYSRTSCPRKWEPTHAQLTEMFAKANEIAGKILGHSPFTAEENEIISEQVAEFVLRVQDEAGAEKEEATSGFCRSTLRFFTGLYSDSKERKELEEVFKLSGEVPFAERAKVQEFVAELEQEFPSMLSQV